MKRVITLEMHIKQLWCNIDILSEKTDIEIPRDAMCHLIIFLLFFKVFLFGPPAQSL